MKVIIGKCQRCVHVLILPLGGIVRRALRVLTHAAICVNLAVCDCVIENIHLILSTLGVERGLVVRWVTY